MERIRANTGCLDKYREDAEMKLEKATEGYQDVEEQWQDLKTAEIYSATCNIGYSKKSVTKKPWVTDEMLRKMDERSKCKHVNSVVAKKRSKQLNNELRRKTDKAKDKWWDEDAEK